MANEFILTVGNVEIYQNDVLVAVSETETSNTITQSVNTQEIRGGEFAQLLLEYSLEKTLEINLTDARWLPEFLAFNNGSNFVSETINSYERESVTLVSDNGTLSMTPVGDIFVERQNGSIQTVTPTGSNFTVAGAGNETVEVYFRTSKSVDRLQIEANRFPGTFKLIVRNKIFNSDNGQGTPIGELISVVPNWKVMGNTELTFDMGTPLTSTLNGKALAYNDPDSNKTIYADIIIDKTSANVNADIVNLFATPDSATLDISEGDTLQITTFGIRGNGRTNISNPTGVTYVSGTPANATVSASGLVTPVQAGTSTITCSLVVGSNTYTDTVAIVVQA